MTGGMAAQQALGVVRWVVLLLMHLSSNVETWRSQAAKVEEARIIKVTNLPAFSRDQPFQPHFWTSTQVAEISCLLRVYYFHT